MVALRTKRAFPRTPLPAHLRTSSMPGLQPAGMGYPFAGALGRQLHECLSLPAQSLVAGPDRPQTCAIGLGMAASSHANSKRSGMGLLITRVNSMAPVGEVTPSTKEMLYSYICAA